MGSSYSTINKWKNEHPKYYAQQLINKFGGPTCISKHSATWDIKDKKPYIEIKVVDEWISHKFPQPHHDDIYTTISLKNYKRISPEVACNLMKVSGSILIDLLKQEATVRCAGLMKNDVTLSFVIDVLMGKALATRKEYARRIKNNIITRKELNLYEV